MMSIKMDERSRSLTGIERLRVHKIMKENDPQLKVDQIVLATQICMKENRQAKVDDIVQKTKLAMNILKNESRQTKVDRLVEYAKLAALA